MDTANPNRMNEYQTQDIQQLQNKMSGLCEIISKKLNKFQTKLKNSNFDFNADFDDIELFEEKVDELFYNYSIIKKDICAARLTRYYIEENELLQKEKEGIEKELHLFSFQTPILK